MIAIGKIEFQFEFNPEERQLKSQDEIINYVKEYVAEQIDNMVIHNHVYNYVEVMLHDSYYLEPEDDSDIYTIKDGE